MSPVKLEGVANFSAMEREYDKVEAKNRQLRGALQMNAGESKKGALEAKKDLDTWKQGIVSLHGENTRLQQKIKAVGQTSKEASEKQKQGAREVAEKQREVAKVTDAVAQKHRVLAKAAKQAYAETRTPQEQYNARIKRLDTLLAKTTMTQQTYNRAVGQAKEKLDSAGGAGKKAFGASAIARIAQMAAGYLSVSTAIRVVIASIKDKEEQEQKALTANISLAGLQAQALTMLGAGSVAEVDAFVERVDVLAANVLPVGGKKEIYRSLAGTLSATKDIDLAFRATGLGAQLGKASPDEAQVIAKGMINLAQVTGETKDLMKNAGFLLAAVPHSLVQTLAGLSQYGTVAVKSGAFAGGTPKEGFALFGALSKAMIDSEGRRTKTAYISLAKSLNEFLPEKDITETKKGKEIVKTEATGLKTTRERLEMLWKDPEKRAEFQRDYVLKMEKGAIGGVISLIQGPQAAKLADAMVSRDYLAAIADLPDVQDAAPRAEAMLRALNRPVVQQLAGEERTRKSTVEQLRTETGTGQAMAKAANFSAKALDDVLAASGMGYVDRMLAVTVRYRGSLTSSNEEAYQRGIRQRMATLLYPDVDNQARASLGVPTVAPKTLARFAAQRTTDPERIKRAQILERDISGPGAQLSRGGGAFEDVDNLFSLITTTVEPGAGGSKDISAPTMESQLTESNRLLGMLVEGLVGPTPPPNRPRNLTTHSE